MSRLDFPTPNPEKVKKIIKREKFTPEEDQTILNLVEKNKQNWELIAEEFGTSRSKRQLRERWQNYLNPECSPEYSPEEDDFLMRLVAEHGQKWSKIASIIGNKSGISCRNRHRVLSKIQNKYFLHPRPSSCQPTIKRNKPYPIPISRAASGLVQPVVSVNGSSQPMVILNQVAVIRPEDMIAERQDESIDKLDFVQFDDSFAIDTDDDMMISDQQISKPEEHVEPRENVDVCQDDGFSVDQSSQDSCDSTFDFQNPKVEASWDDCGVLMSGFENEDDYFIDAEYMC